MYWNKKIRYLRDCSKEMFANHEYVTTNGCFDTLHIGHLDSLYKSSNLGSRLAVGINSDLSVIKLKGPGRPLQSEKVRASVLAALPFVHDVVIFDESDPIKFIETICPIVHCKGNDYLGREDCMPEAKVLQAQGIKLELIEYTPGYSTSDLVKKILRKNVN